MNLLFNIKILREEPDLVTISMTRAVLCTKCRQISNTKADRCGFCDSNTLVRLSEMIDLPQEPPPQPGAAMGKVLRFAA
jgi:hypothetical protein